MGSRWDLGTDTTEAVDYPDIAGAVARSVARGETDAGIVIDGAGIGSAIAANKVRGVRAAMCDQRDDCPLLARAQRRERPDIGSVVVGADAALRHRDMWLATPMREPRYIRRL